MASRKKQSSAAGINFFIIIFTALFAQLLGHYHGDGLIIGSNFFLSWVLLRIVIPVAVLLALRVPFSRLGLGLPQVDRKMARLLIGGIIAVMAVFSGIYFLQGYFNTYGSTFGAASRLERFANFMVFTSSTLTGWEFIHRCFLLMGLQYVLTERDRVDPAVAARVAIVIVWIFEVVFHFIKPEVEALGLLVGSPLLSWLAIRTKSIWLAFLMHLLVEILFILALIMR